MCRPNPTIHTLNDYTLQEIADFCIISLLRQGKPGYNANGGCSYLTDDGLKCSVGFLLDKETAEGHRTESLYSLISALYVKVPRNVSGFLADMQVSHDRMARLSRDTFIDSFMENIRKTLLRYGIDDSAIITEYARLYGDS